MPGSIHGEGVSTLRAFLRRHRFSARTAVIGLPARWLLSREKLFPPAGPAALAGLAHIEAERSFAAERDQLVVDYASGPASPEGVPVLLTAISRERADQLQALSQAAGLRLRALASTSMTLAAALRPDLAWRLMLLLRPDHVEVVMRSGGRFMGIRHVALPPSPVAEAGRERRGDWLRALADSVDRLAALMPQEEPSDASEPVVVWDGVGLAAGPLGDIARPLDLETDLRVVLNAVAARPAPSNPAATGQQFAGAVALALVGVRGGSLPVDFLHSRLGAAKRSRNGRRIAWAAAVVATVLLGCASLLAEWRREEGKSRELHQHLRAMKPDIEAAQSIVQQVTTARGWTDRRTRFLEPLRELTLVFPTQGGVWVSSLAIREDLRVAVSGKASDERAVLDLLDRIRGGPSFSGVKLLYLRAAGGNGQQVAFAMTFDFAEGE